MYGSNEFYWKNARASKRAGENRCVPVGIEARSLETDMVPRLMIHPAGYEVHEGPLSDARALELIDSKLFARVNGELHAYDSHYGGS